MNAPRVGLIAQGAMGAGIGRRLVERGLTVTTVLEGRSEASARRAREAGMQPVPLAAMAEVDIFLSVVPPADATALAASLAPVLAAAPHKPLYADLNAISPDTVAWIAAKIAPTGCAFADGGILGGPPGPTGKGPAVFTSGPGAAGVARLAAYGLDVRVMDGPVGAASALKMCYGGITKGFNAMAAAVLLAADRAGVADVLRQELIATQPGLFHFLERMMPGTYDKAYRFAPEMREIAGFMAPDVAGDAIYEAFALLYGQMAADRAGLNRQTSTLTRVLKG